MVDKVEKDEYDEMATEVPEREVEVLKGQFGSYSEQEDNNPLLSDFQSAQKRLFPDFGDPVLNRAGVSRIGTDVFLDMLYLGTVRTIYKHKEEEDIDVIGALMDTYNALAIGIDGKGREDDIVMAGSARETEELKKLSSNLGF